MTVVYRKDYAPPAFWIDRVDLQFDLDPRNTIVTARISFRRNQDQPPGDLELQGEQLTLKSVAIDDQELGDDQFRVTRESLTVCDPPDEFVLETVVEIDPESNKSLYGLYLSSGNFCTQCEALGFRRISHFLDRPDVMARYAVTIRANHDRFPVLLSNGNRVNERDLGDGRHEVVWEDPFPKPSYLFALVAGNLKCHRGLFRTKSGRDVALEIWVEPQNIDRCDHALESLQKAMAWDEEVFGLEYDLDVYMVVAVNDFNMGAMENKGLNIFNSKYVLASPETATDTDFLAVEAVIAHEYFHNWTGNRVTCRDWFQLTLKEGLTVFRDQQFTADQTSAAVKRIDDVVALRSRQFAEDNGPMAHPIRPESYIAMDNFYTATVYNKGAEVIRMFNTLLGDDGFRHGIDLYFQRHDGCAVTCDDFRAAMADANDRNLDAFDLWYSQAGTPELEVSEDWDEAGGCYTLHFRQSYPPLPDSIPGVADRQPVPIPIRIGVIDQRVKDLPMPHGSAGMSDRSSLFLLDQSEGCFVVEDLTAKPAASILRGFSAPVRLKMDRGDAELAFLMAHDCDSFNRWDAGQSLAMRLMQKLASQGPDSLAGSDSLERFLNAFGIQLSDETMDGSYRALLLTLPIEAMLGQEMEVVDPDAIHTAREFLKVQILKRYSTALRSLYGKLSSAVDGKEQDCIDRRRLKNTVLGYLAAAKSSEATNLVAQQFDNSDNMTDTQAALILLTEIGGAECERALETFYEQWKGDPLVLDKWFAVQAASKQEDTLDRVKNLTRHHDFNVTNPNRVRALLQTFAMNQVRFHAANGSGYQLLTDFVLQIDADNPQLAARLVSQMNGYRRFEEERQQLMRGQLERIAASEHVSRDLGEIVQRALQF